MQRHCITGLDRARIRQCQYVLSLDDLNLSDLFGSVVRLVEVTNLALVSELQSAKLDVTYWENLSRNSKWSIMLTQLNSYVFRKVFFQSRVIEWPSEHDINHSLSTLHSVINDLACVLSQINDVAGYLKRIYVEVQAISQISPCERQSFVLSKGLMNKLSTVTKSNLQRCLQLYYEVITQFRGAVLIVPGSERDRAISSNATMQQNLNELYLQCDDLAKEVLRSHKYQVLHSLVHAISHEQLCAVHQVEYPLDVVSEACRRPTKLERVWLRRAVVFLCTCVVAKHVWAMAEDGSLRQLAVSVRDSVTAAAQDHIIGPVRKLFHELFESIDHGEEIVSRADLEKSREALIRMLDEFKESAKGQRLIQPFLEKTGLADMLMSDVDSSNAVSSSTASLVAGDSIMKDMDDLALTGHISFSHQEALHALMRSYESELQHPIRGALFGNLLTSVLIQMQKLKVHTEAAMLKMDQIIASNNLTMASTAALPSFALIGAIIYVVRRAMRPVTVTASEANMSLRLALASVERDLHAVHDQHAGTASDTLLLSEGVTCGQYSMSLAASGSASSPRSPRSPVRQSHAPSSLVHPNANNCSNNHCRESASLVRSDSAGFLAPDPDTDQSPLSGSVSDYAAEAGARAARAVLATPGTCAASATTTSSSSSSSLSAPLVLVPSVTFVDKGREALVSRGLLCYHTCRLRERLYLYHKSHMDSAASDTSAASYHQQLQTYSNLPSSYRSSLGIASLGAWFNQIIFGIHDEDQYMVSETSSIVTDMLLLEAPDFEVSGGSKFATILRMRSSYRCFSTNN